MSKKVFEVEALNGRRYAVFTDQRNYVIHEWHEPKKPDAKTKLGWKVAKAPYHGSLASAVQRILGLGVQDIDATSLQDLVRKMDGWGRRIFSACRGEYDPAVDYDALAQREREADEASKAARHQRLRKPNVAAKPRQPEPEQPQKEELPAWLVAAQNGG